MDVIKEAEVELLLLAGLQVIYRSYPTLYSLPLLNEPALTSKFMTYQCQRTCPISNAITGFGK